MPPKTPTNKSPEKASASSSAVPELTASETKLMALAFVCLRENPSVSIFLHSNFFFCPFILVVFSTPIHASLPPFPVWT